MMTISLFADIDKEEATLALYQKLAQIELPEHILLTINNLPEAESGILRSGSKIRDISLANCYELEDVIRELIMLILRECEE